MAHQKFAEMADPYSGFRLPQIAGKKKRCEPTAFTPKHTHQEENNLEISQNNNLRRLYDAAHYGG